MNGISPFAAVIAALAILTLGACASSERRGATEASLRPINTVPTDRLVEMGKGLLDKEQQRDAARLFIQALDQQPDHVEAKLGLAEAYLGSGAISAAATLFAELTQTPQVQSAATQGQAISLLLLGHSDKAKELLLRLAGAEALSWRGWNALGRCHDLKQRWDSAADAYAMALKAKPDAHIVHNNLGMSYLAQSRYSEAEAKFMDALTLRPDFEVSRNNLRFTQALQGKYRDAFAGATRQDLPVVLNNVGYAALLRGEGDRAQAYFTRAMEASPHFFDVAFENLRRAKGPDAGAD